jgi:hypothetical protein
MSINEWKTEGYTAVPLYDATWDKDDHYGYQILDPKIKQKADLLPCYEKASKNWKTCQKILKVAAIISLISLVSAIQLALVANPIGIGLCCAIGAVFIAYMLAKEMEAYYLEKAQSSRHALEQKMFFEQTHPHLKA